MVRGFVGSLVILLALVPAAMAQSDCGGGLSAARGKLAQVREPERRQEIAKLLEKAEKDDRNGRAKLCGAALQRAQFLLAK